MQNQSGEENYAFDRPGTYSIRVLGFVDESWSDRLAGMHISTVSLDDKGPVRRQMIKVRNHNPKP